jgi:hypothetical protein
MEDSSLLGKTRGGANTRIMSLIFWSICRIEMRGSVATDRSAVKDTQILQEGKKGVT